MPFSPLPYLSRPLEEAYLREFLVQRLQPQPGLSRALLLCGDRGVGKRTLLRRVFESDPRLRAYQLADSDTRGILTDDARSREAQDLVTDVIAPVASAASPAAAPIIGIAQGVANYLTRDRTAETALDPFLEGSSTPLLLVVPGFDPDEPRALRALGHYINQARDRSLPRALVIVDDSARLRAAEPEPSYGTHPGISRGLARLREYVRDDQWLEVLPVHPLSAEQCRENFTKLGLSPEWARVLYQLSDGGIHALRALWERMQERGILVPAGGGRWKTLQSASASAGWELVEDDLDRLIEARLKGDTTHKARLLDAFHLAACMGSTFLPQAVAEAVMEADPKRDQLDRDAWEDIWYEMLEGDDAEHPAIAPRCTSGDDPGILRADDRQCFVHAFRDPALANLLRAAARKRWSDWKKTPGQPRNLLVEAGTALEAWVQRAFQETWPQALSFRAALLRVQRRESEANRAEDLDLHIRSAERLRRRVELKRQGRRDEEGAADLYAALLWYAEVLDSLGRFTEETDALREAMELVDTGGIRLPTPHYLCLQADLGMALVAQGAYEQGEPLLVKNLRRWIEHHGQDHPDTLASADLLAGLYLRQGRYAEAEPLFLWAVEGRGRVLGPDHPHTLSSVTNLAALYEKQGRHAEAEPLSLRVLEGREQRFGRDHPETLLAANNLGYQYLTEHRYGEAEPLLLWAFRGRELAFGRDHPDTLNASDNLARLYLAQGRHSEAEPLSLRAMEGRERVLGPDHPDTLTSVHNLAMLYEGQGRDTQAELLFVRALDGYGRVLGPMHPHTLHSAHSLGLLRERRGRYADAETLLVRALEGRRLVLGAEHPSTLNATHSLASLHFRQGRHAEAEHLFAIAFEGRKRMLGPDHPTTRHARARLEETRRTIERGSS